ncbi:chymotrypsin-2-like [Temnothorax americanus]|uniref:chymotrypsin-2-like n=1 Tax=Temnothorax americanus TaxID=1964332 RepID=UPI0040697A2B
MGRHAERTIMSPLSTKVLLCIVFCLSMCQYTQSLYLGSESRNVTSDNPVDVIVLDANNDEAITNITEGSTTALTPSFSYMVTVYQFLDGKYLMHCTGTILSQRWVLTAANCVGRNSGTLFVDFGIDVFDVVQIISRTAVFFLIEKFGIGHNFLRAFSSVLMIPTQAFIHPQYARANNDIALLYMPQDIPFSNNIQPVKLAYYESFVNKVAYAVGWKTDKLKEKNNTASEYSPRPAKLKYAMLPIIENNICRQYWPINDNHICTATGYGQIFTCAIERKSSDPLSDPLIVRKNGQDFQIGIMTLQGDDGDPCLSKKPHMFTKVSSYTDWIREVMNKRH